MLEHNDVPVALAEGTYRVTEVLEAAALEDATPIDDGSPVEDRTPIEPATLIEYVVDFSALRRLARPHGIPRLIPALVHRGRSGVCGNESGL